jgi:hypothetical protein
MAQVGNDDEELCRQQSEEVLLEDSIVLPIQTNRISLTSGDYYQKSFTCKQQNDPVSKMT